MNCVFCWITDHTPRVAMFVVKGYSVCERHVRRALTEPA